MNSTISSLLLFQILRQKVGEKEAEALVDFVDYKIKENNEDNQKTLATKEDIHLLKEDIHLLKEDIIRVEGKLETKIEGVRSDIVRWVFGFFVALALMVIGLYFRK